MHLTRRTLSALAPAALLAAGVQDEGAEPAPAAVILVRHAETAGDTRTGRDPALSGAGEARATALAQLLGQAGITHLFASEYKRTQATLAPLAAAVERKVQVVPARDAAAQIAQLKALPPGSLGVVAGHSNTIPALVEALGGTFRRHPDAPEGPPTILHGEYGRLFLQSGATIELRF